MDDLSIILPVFNERKGIEIVLKEWEKELNQNGVKFQFVVCEDGSTDGTGTYLKKIQKKYNLTLNQKQFRRGYGGAVIDGIKTAKNKYILSIDSDGQCDPKDFAKFWRNRKKADVVIGWRTKRADPIQRKLYSFLFKLIFKILFPVNIHDPSAPFVLFKKKNIIPFIDYLKYLREGFWWGFIAMCVKKNLTIYEIPVRHRQRLVGKTVVYENTRIPGIAFRNIIGLIKLKYSHT